MRHKTLTPALSRPTGEGESRAVFSENLCQWIAEHAFRDTKTLRCCPSLPSDGREVRGEGCFYLFN